MQSNILTKNQNQSIMLWTCFLTMFFRKLFHKNENWTFLKMSKSVKNSREFENIIDLFGNAQIKKRITYFLFLCKIVCFLSQSHLNDYLDIHTKPTRVMQWYTRISPCKQYTSVVCFLQLHVCSLWPTTFLLPPPKSCGTSNQLFFPPFSRMCWRSLRRWYPMSGQAASAVNSLDVVRIGLENTGIFFVESNNVFWCMYKEDVHLISILYL